MCGGYACATETVVSPCRVVYTTCLEKFDVSTPRKSDKFEMSPNRRYVQKGGIRSGLNRRLKEVSSHERAGLQDLIKDFYKKILMISKVENLRKRQKRKRTSRG